VIVNTFAEWGPTEYFRDGVPFQVGVNRILVRTVSEPFYEPVRLFELQIHGTPSGLYEEDGLRQRLEEYRRDNPRDPRFAGVVVIEIPTARRPATRRSVFDFIEEDP
jgi:hypothetical protein